LVLFKIQTKLKPSLVAEMTSVIHLSDTYKRESWYNMFN